MLAVTALLTVVALCFVSCKTGPTSANLEKSAQLAMKLIANGQKDNGSWPVLITNDSTLKKYRRKPDVMANLYIDYILASVDENFLNDDVLEKSINYLASSVDSGSGMIALRRRTGVLECNLGLNALYWYSPNTIATMSKPAIDTLNRYKLKTGLYPTSLMKKGITRFHRVGGMKKPADLSTNIRMLLLFSKRVPKLAKKLHEVIDKELQAGNLLVVNHNYDLWAVYLHEVDLEKQGFKLNIKIEKNISYEGQAKYAEMAVLIRDLSLNQGNKTKNLSRAAEMLDDMSSNKFATFKENPMLLYHNDLGAKKQVFVYSPHVPMALWLRLYAEYNKGQRMI